MILPLNKIVSNYNLQIKGVIHAGAHWGEEYQDYVNAGIKYMMFFEPVRDNFLKLSLKVPETNEIKLYQYALGSENRTGEIYIETENSGQSCSLLEPGTHLTLYPKITFPCVENIWIKKLDSFKFDKKNFNMLNMDVQGYELEILKGATETLKFIDIIYTEINTEDVYKNCVKVKDLDAFLKEFKFNRIVTKMACKAWGDALYIKEL